MLRFSNPCSLAPRRLARWMLASSAVTAALLAPQLVAQPAAATVGQPTRVYERSPMSTASHKEVTARCPRGTVALGGGAIISGDGVHYAGLTRAQVTPDSGGYVAAASSGVSWSWRLTVAALCAPEPPGYLVRNGLASVSAGVAQPSHSLECPSTHTAVSVGGRVWAVDSNQRVYLRALDLEHRPAYSNLAAITAVRDRHPRDAQVAIHIRVVCTSAQSVFRVSSVGSPWNHSSPKSRQARCPDGTWPYGVGAVVSGDNHSQNRLKLTRFWPIPAAAAPRGDTTVRSVAPDFPVYAAWWTRAVLTCGV